MLCSFRTFTFWRFAISVPLGPTEMKVRYSINRGQQLEFYVPGSSQNMRWAAHSVRDICLLLESLLVGAYIGAGFSVTGSRLV